MLILNILYKYLLKIQWPDLKLKKKKKMKEYYTMFIFESSFEMWVSNYLAPLNTRFSNATQSIVWILICKIMNILYSVTIIVSVAFLKKIYMYLLYLCLLHMRNTFNLFFIIPGKNHKAVFMLLVIRVGVTCRCRWWWLMTGS